MVLVGDKDIENNCISVRHRKEGDLGSMTVERFIEKAVEEINSKEIK